MNIHIRYVRENSRRESSEGVNTSVAASTTTGSLCGGGPTAEWFKPSFIDGEVAGLELTETPRHLYKLFKGCLCVCFEGAGVLLFLARLHPVLGNRSWCKEFVNCKFLQFF